MARVEKLLTAMRRNPRGDWRIDDLKALADRFGIPYRQPGTSHVIFAPPRRSVLSVPAARPVKPVYIRGFVAMIEARQRDTENDEP